MSLFRLCLWHPFLWHPFLRRLHRLCPSPMPLSPCCRCSRGWRWCLAPPAQHHLHYPVPGLKKTLHRLICPRVRGMFQPGIPVDGNTVYIPVRPYQTSLLLDNMPQLMLQIPLLAGTDVYLASPGIGIRAQLSRS